MCGFWYSDEGVRKLRDECGGAEVNVVDIFNEGDIKMAKQHKGTGNDFKVFLKVYRDSMLK